MGSVIYLTDKKPIPPKSETFEHAGQRYTCTFDPNAPKDQRWVWKVDYVRIYPQYGACPTMEAAARKARLHIHAMNKHITASEENE